MVIAHTCLTFATMATGDESLISGGLKVISGVVIEIDFAS